MIWLIVALSLMAQINSDPTIDLEFERRAMFRSQPRSNMMIIKAEWPDGKPVHKPIVSCTGPWSRYKDTVWKAEEPKSDYKEGGWAFPFQGDARGAMIFNPDFEDVYFICKAQKDGKHGTVAFWMSEEGTITTKTIILNKEGDGVTPGLEAEEGSKN